MGGPHFTVKGELGFQNQACIGDIFRIGARFFIFKRFQVTLLNFKAQMECTEK